MNFYLLYFIDRYNIAQQALLILLFSGSTILCPYWSWGWIKGLFGGQKNLSFVLKRAISLCNLFCGVCLMSTSSEVVFCLNGVEIGYSVCIMSRWIKRNVSMHTSQKTLVDWGSLPNGMYIRFFLRRNGFMCSLWTLWTKISSISRCFQWPHSRSKNQTKWTWINISPFVQSQWIIGFTSLMFFVYHLQFYPKRFFITLTNKPFAYHCMFFILIASITYIFISVIC